MNRTSFRPAWVALLALLLAAPAASLTAGIAHAQVPRTMTVQGILWDASGIPVEAMTTFRFELLDGTASVWMEQQSVTPRAGLFTVRLGTETPLDPADFATGLALRISVAGETMEPIPLTSVPYALRAETVETYDGDVSWGQVTGVPAGFADGTDDGNTYAAGTGLTLDGSTFAVDAAVVQTRVSATCATGSAIRAIAEDGTVACEATTPARPGRPTRRAPGSASPAAPSPSIRASCRRGSPARAAPDRPCGPSARTAPSSASRPSTARATASR